MPEPDYTLLCNLVQQVQKEQRVMRAEQRNMNLLVSNIVSALTRLTSKIDGVGQQISREITDARDELIMVIKSEVSGQSGMIESRLEQRVEVDLADLIRRVEALEKKVS